MGLGVGIDQENAVSQKRQCGGDVEGGCGLPHSAFLVGNGDDQAVSSKDWVAEGFRLIYWKEKIKEKNKKDKEIEKKNDQASGRSGGSAMSACRHWVMSLIINKIIFLDGRGRNNVGPDLPISRESGLV
jgi:hypothetical protein